MPTPSRTTVLAVLAAAAVGVAVPVALAQSGDEAPSAVPDRSTAAVIELPGLVPATGDPVLPGFATAHPAPGTTARVAGPFDDRFDIVDERVAGGTATGVLTVTSDVSEIIDLQVVVAFYDRAGVLLGTGTWEKHGEGAKPDEVVSYTVTAPTSYRSRVSAAAVGVPVLVNE